MIPVSPRVLMYAGAALVLALAGWRVMVWRDGYMERDAAVEALDTATKDYAAKVQEWEDGVAAYTKQIETDAKTIREAATESVRIRFERDQLLGRVAELKARGKLTVEVPSEKPNTCPAVRLGADVRLQFNAATSATADPAR